MGNYSHFFQRDAVRMLAKQPRANINAADSEGRTALMYAAEYGHYDCVEALLEKQPDLSLCDNFGCNALHYALWTEKPDPFIVRILCQSGVPIHKRNKEGQTALHLAAKRNQHKLIPTLLGWDLRVCPLFKFPVFEFFSSLIFSIFSLKPV